MIFLVNNCTKYFFPIFLINYRKEFDYLSIIILIIEVGGYLTAFLLTVRGCYVIFNTRVFHWNLNFCICGCFCQWFEILTAKLMVAAHHKGWIILDGNDPNKTYSEFYTTDTSDMPKISSFWDCPFLFIGMILITHYYTFSVISLTGITIERSFATYWINNYECKKRPWISISIFILLESFSAFVAYTGITMNFHVYYWIVIGIGLLIFNILLFVYIWYWNVRVHKILEKIQTIPEKYTLQARFQVKENARSLNLLKVIFIVVNVSLLLESAFFVVQWTQAIKKYEVVLFWMLEFMNSQNPVSLITLAMMTVPRWRRRFYKPFEFIPLVKKYILKDPTMTAVVEVRPAGSTVNLETEEYFSQLRNAWA
ncbi:hypothetical protein CAEBREN_04847 [Caenorhabditis brenneri]|uniref:Uncharacterized protein n=1 Tax=Caenorhabditis brenneri TaxID=135651 RepID=G0N775_CAEBE|nr:hypothetical protein CAEBREN_04847 [Caenorhabditis brenneri]